MPGLSPLVSPPLLPELGVPINFRLVFPLTEAFQWPDWAGFGWGQGGLWGGIGELSRAGAVPSELTASRNWLPFPDPCLPAWACGSELTVPPALQENKAAQVTSCSPFFSTPHHQHLVPLENLIIAWRKQDRPTEQ